MSKSMYVNASVIICGGVCLVRVITHIMLRASDWNNPSIPGLVFMSDLCYPLLFTWIGLLLRGWKPESAWWIQLAVSLIAIYGLYRYCDWTADCWHIAHLDLAMMALGYLIPPKFLRQEGEKTGWLSLIMLMLSVFCFTAVSVVKQRLLWGDLMPEHQDMEKLIEALLWVTEPLLGLIAAYFVIQFSFSATALCRGGRKWMRILAAGVCCLSFVWAFQFFLTVFHRLAYMVNYVYYSPYLSMFVQPISVYLVVAFYRRMESRKMLPWKECFKL